AAELRRLVGQAVAIRGNTRIATAAPAPPPPRPAPPRPQAPAPRPPRPAAIAGDEPPRDSRTEQKILDALAELQVLGVPEPDRVQVAFLAGYTNLSSKGFANALGSLRTSGAIDYPQSGRVGLTDVCRGRAQFPNRPQSPDAL